MTLSERYRTVCDSMDIEFASRRENVDEAVERLIEAAELVEAQFKYHGASLDELRVALALLKSAIAKMEGK